MTTKEQLIGGNKDSDEICRIIGADSLRYIPLNDLVASCGGGKFCTGCFSGDYAVPKEELLTEAWTE